MLWSRLQIEASRFHKLQDPLAVQAELRHGIDDVGSRRKLSGWNRYLEAACLSGLGYDPRRAVGLLSTTIVVVRPQHHVASNQRGCLLLCDVFERKGGQPKLAG